MPDCCAQGEYRAPKSRKNLRDYWWFCLEHVRAYNATWDYYKGMGPSEIEAELRRDTAWQRPSWPLGRLGGGGSWDEDMLRDPLRLLASGRLRNSKARPPGKAPAELREPLATMGLSWPVTLADLKARYKELAKAHHPDANGGDRAAEERLKTINLAYATLRSRLAQQPGLAAAG
jgi:DnaJ-like protein